MEQIIEEAQIIRFYDIYSKLGNLVYTGSTELTIKQRFGQHKCQYKRWKNGKTNHTGSFDLFDKYGIEHCTIKEISSQICDKTTRDAVESGRILLHRADVTRISVNKQLPGVRKDTERKAQQKQYRDDNIDTIKQYNKQYYVDNIDKNKVHYIENIDTIKAHSNEKHVCDKCQGKYTTTNKARHDKSPKHQQSITNNYNITININVK